MLEDHNMFGTVTRLTLRLDTFPLKLPCVFFMEVYRFFLSRLDCN